MVLLCDVYIYISVQCCTELSKIKELFFLFINFYCLASVSITWLATCLLSKLASLYMEAVVAAYLFH